MSKEEQGELSESVLELRDQVDQLIKQGKIEEAMEIIKRREKTEGIEELRWRIVEIKCRNRKGEYEHVMEITEETIKVIEEIEEPVEEKGEKERIKIDALNEQVWALLRLGRQDEGLEKVEEGIRLIKELEEKEGEQKDKERIANLLNNKGNVYYQKGELDHALDYYKMSLAIREEIGDKLDIAASLNNLGIVYRMKGELGPALNKFKRSLSLKEEIDNKQSIAASLNNIGDLYQELGALEMALSFLKQGLALREETGNKHWFFILDGCLNPDAARGFYNEFLDEKLTEHRKVFEVLGSKMKVAESTEQLSGLGFSSTQKNSVLCKVTGSFTRTIKINF